MLIDSFIILAIGVVLYSQLATRKKVKDLRDLMVSLEPVLKSFSEDVDRTENSFSTMRDGVEDVAERLSKSANDTEKRIRLMKSIRGSSVSDNLASGSSMFSTKKENMINGFFDMAKTRES